MVYNPNLGLIIIHGGRNDDEGICFNDLHSLNVSNLCWCKVSLYNHDLIQEARYCFAYGIRGSKMYVFGGINFIGFAGAGVKVLEMDQNRARIRYEQERGIYQNKLSRSKTKKIEIADHGQNGINQTTRILSFLPIPAEKVN